MQDGDKNTKVFHSYVKGRRKKFHISRIQNEQGLDLVEEELIETEVVGFFSRQFQREKFNRDWSMLSQIPKMISEEENKEMVLHP